MTRTIPPCDWGRGTFRYGYALRARSCPRVVVGAKTEEIVMLDQVSGTEERDHVATDTDLGVVPPEERGDRAVIARLIRRLRISDSPKDFQTVATTVLRTSLDLAAVAWIPKDSHEPAVI